MTPGHGRDTVGTMTTPHPDDCGQTHATEAEAWACETTTPTPNPQVHAHPRTEARTTTYWVGMATVYTPTETFGEREVTYLECVHQHTTPEAADRCSIRLARKAERR